MRVGQENKPAAENKEEFGKIGKEPRKMAEKKGINQKYKKGIVNFKQTFVSIWIKERNK